MASASLVIFSLAAGAQSAANSKPRAAGKSHAATPTATRRTATAPSPAKPRAGVPTAASRPAALQTPARSHAAVTTSNKNTSIKRTPVKRRAVTRRMPYRQRLARLRLGPERVKEIQQALVQVGYLNQEPNGNWDDPTRDAMRRYQADHGFPTTGMPEAKSLLKLGLGPHPLPPEVDSTAQAQPSAENPAAPDTTVSERNQAAPAHSGSPPPE